MKNILVPTDFSACAAAATELALMIAKQDGAMIHLFTTLEFENKLVKALQQKENYSGEDIRKIKNAELLFSEWESKAKQANIAIRTYWTAGNLIENIKEAVLNFNIDVVVMGSHGTSGKKEYFIGSNTQKAVRSVHCPVLVVKESIKDFKLEKVIFASNFDESEKAAFQYLLDFVRPARPEIHLLQVNTSGWFSQPYLLVRNSMKKFEAMCGDLVCESHFYRDWTVDSGIRKFAIDIGANLIAISNKQRHPLKRMVSGSNVEALVNHARLPVLSIDFPEAG